MNGNYTVVTTMKNEGPYILEWVAYHKALGFKNLIVATNDSTDPTVAILSRLEALGLVRMHKTIIRSGGIQRSALKQATRLYKESTEADWLYICDVDEYLNIKVGDGKVDDLLDASTGTQDVIEIPWRVFGPGAIQSIKDEPIIKQFHYAESYDPNRKPFQTGKFKKSIYRNFSKYQRPGVHGPVKKPGLEEPVLRELPGNTQSVYDAYAVAQINHYALRSADSFLVKRERGRVNHSKQTMGIDYWNRFNLSHQFDQSILRMASDVETKLAEFKSDPELAYLHALAVEWHQMRAETLKSDPEYKTLIDVMAKTNVIEPKADILPV